jgi:hypothetical protein
MSRFQFSGLASDEAQLHGNCHFSRPNTLLKFLTSLRNDGGLDSGVAVVYGSPAAMASCACTTVLLAGSRDHTASNQDTPGNVLRAARLVEAVLRGRTL